MNKQCINVKQGKRCDKTEVKESNFCREHLEENGYYCPLCCEKHVDSAYKNKMKGMVEMLDNIQERLVIKDGRNPS